MQQNQSLEITKVVLDAMGGDYAPAEPVKGAVDAVNARRDIKILLVGQEDVVRKELEKYTYPTEQIEVIHAEEVIETAEPPVNAIRKKKQSSIVVGMNMVKQRCICISRKFRSHISRRTGYCRQDQRNRETTVSTAYSDRKGSVTSDRLRGECRCKGITSCSVCKDGFHLYGECTWNQKSESSDR